MKDVIHVLDMSYIATTSECMKCCDEEMCSSPEVGCKSCHAVLTSRKKTALGGETNHDDNSSDATATTKIANRMIQGNCTAHLTVQFSKTYPL